jgi:hypothetical protein
MDVSFSHVHLKFSSFTLVLNMPTNLKSPEDICKLSSHENAVISDQRENILKGLRREHIRSAFLHFDPRFICYLIAVMWLSGCAVTTDRAQVDWITPEGYEVYEHGLDPTPIYPKRTEAEQAVFEENFKTFDQWVDDASGHRSHRDRAQLQLISLSDQMCERHLAGIHGNTGAINMGFDIAAMALSGAAAIVKPKRPAQVYGGLAALASGSRVAFNANVLYNMLAPAIIAKIRALRQEAYTQMKTMRAQSLSSYGAADAINDALRYHHQCSLYIGIQTLTEDAGLRKQSDLTSSSAQIRDDTIARITNLKGQLAALKQTPGADSSGVERLIGIERLLLQRFCLAESKIIKDDQCVAPTP